MKRSSGVEFRQIVSGQNFMTPTVVDYWQVGHYQCEVSKGEGVSGDTIYGVTTADLDTSESVHELSQCFESYNEAKAFIKGLEGKQ